MTRLRQYCMTTLPSVALDTLANRKLASTSWVTEAGRNENHLRNMLPGKPRREDAVRDARWRLHDFVNERGRSTINLLKRVIIVRRATRRKWGVMFHV